MPLLPRSSPRPAPIAIPASALDGLRQRLAEARWPDRETVKDESQGVRLADVRDLIARWRDGYDWHACERRINGWNPQSIDIDGLGIHFLHVRSPHADARPLLLTHGWPSSVLEFRHVIDPLTRPLDHGGSAGQAFHLVIPALPGFGFSASPAAAGWGVERIAQAWYTLMDALGYDRFFAQGGDWGAAVTAQMAREPRPSLAGIHLSMPIFYPPEPPAQPTEEEQVALDKRHYFRTQGYAYSQQQRERPQTLAYGLADSPVGQAAWIYEKIRDWSDPASQLPFDEVIDMIMLYWLPNKAASSARIYWESPMPSIRPGPIGVPVGVSVFPFDIIGSTRAWAEARFDRLIHFAKLPRGGHFAAWEAPDLFTAELRTCFSSLRG
ncbi:epoxide hydrolase [Sphingobium sp. 22B]|uniref:epoxide hydrolase family protein n=1 Tax=unclassified Sphingobium TaxID=2611147 RepID=UPI000780DCB7|nr:MULTISPECIES: epoxide hydrolase family protein [unclassified Sphingobium]KXU30521.1 epoxide hydrolase [Sphingobium sp. AM]KYC30801.1 epoxide hydrolase [Sphingobium sp. 22B]OAP30078.1 epoxide hydrolase [Sphingobium sp. 20006FA]